MNIVDNRVIVVDDFPDFAINLKKILELDEVSIRVFSDPRSFIDFSKLLSFQECKVLVMDYSMPYMTGFEVFKELYEHTQGVLPPKMILYTANLEQIGKSEIEFMQGIGIELLKKPSVRVLIEKILDNL